MCFLLQSPRDGVWGPKAAGAPAADQVAVRQAGWLAQAAGLDQVPGNKELHLLCFNREKSGKQTARCQGACRADAKQVARPDLGLFNICFMN